MDEFIETEIAKVAQLRRICRCCVSISAVMREPTQIAFRLDCTLEFCSCYVPARLHERCGGSVKGNEQESTLTTVSPDELDSMILALLPDSWRKTAAVIGKVEQACEDRKFVISYDDIFDRTRAPR